MKEQTTTIGGRGETLALSYLTERGCIPVCRNYRAGHKEIDLIVRDGAYLVFVEVKARSSSAFGTPGAFVDKRKQRNLILAAETYLMEHGGPDVPARFDVAEVYLQTGRVNWIQNAFTL